MKKERLKADAELERLKKELKELIETNQKKLDLLKMQEKVMKNTIAKLKSTEKALEVDLSCQKCMNLMTNPVTMIPCGHSFCKHCIDGDVEECPACDMEIEYKFKNELMVVIVSKTKYRKELFKALDENQKLSVFNEETQG